MQLRIVWNIFYLSPFLSFLPLPFLQVNRACQEILHRAEKAQRSEPKENRTAAGHPGQGCWKDGREQVGAFFFWPHQERRKALSFARKGERQRKFLGKYNFLENLDNQKGWCRSWDASPRAEMTSETKSTPRVSMFWSLLTCNGDIVLLIRFCGIRSEDIRKFK